jgi:glycosyltransferase involved in cell wall biosynthesis
MGESSRGTLDLIPASDDPNLAHRSDVLCFSHLRWDFVFQRPQHLMTRCSRERRVFFVEEPTFGSSGPLLDISARGDRIFVVVPRLPNEMSSRQDAQITAQTELVHQLVARQPLRNFLLWFYTPLALPLTLSLEPSATIYDCMDDLSGFAGAHAGLPFLERILFRHADLVLTGGHSLLAAKRHLHGNIHAFPSSVDAEHFAMARLPCVEPADQASIPRPRAGFAGVIDERLDLVLLDEVARSCPHIHFVMLGPVVKIDPASLPRQPNIWYIGPKRYDELPRYQAGWDVAFMPFAHNSATRLISPTKTLEYLAAGRPIVSTSVPDVVEPYGSSGLARIADGPQEFAAAIHSALEEEAGPRLAKADAFLASHSWDRTWASIEALIDSAVRRRGEVSESRISDDR